MRVVALRRLLILVTSLVFIIGSGVQAMASASLIARSHASAEHTVMHHGCATMTELAPMKGPCKRVSLDCAMQCICPSALPAPPAALASPIAWRPLSYWPRRAAALAGLSIKPVLHPPIAA
jgi:hypothetical protein